MPTKKSNCIHRPRLPAHRWWAHPCRWNCNRCEKLKLVQQSNRLSKQCQSVAKILHRKCANDSAMDPLLRTMCRQRPTPQTNHLYIWEGERERDRKKRLVTLFQFHSSEKILIKINHLQLRRVEPSCGKKKKKNQTRNLINRRMYT